MEGVPTLILDKLLDAERAKMNAMPTDERSSGVMRIPQNLSAPMLEGDAQRNVPAILAQIQKEAMEAEMRKKTAGNIRKGQGLSLPMSRGIMTGDMTKIMSYQAIFGE